jgi:hypothetical protein
MIRSFKSQISIGLMLIGMVMLFSAAPAYAEFEGKESKGEGGMWTTTLEAGGGTLECLASEVSTGKAEWTVKKGTTAATKGPDIFINVKKWGKCHVKSAEIKEVEATVGECELEVVQSGTGQEVPVNIVKACVIKALLCEVKVEPKTELNKALVADAEGVKDLFVLVGAKGISTTAKGCLGVKNSTEGKLESGEEMLLEHLVTSPPFQLTATRRVFTPTTAMNTGTVEVENTLATVVTLVTITTLSNSVIWPRPNATDLTTCRTHSYTAVGTVGAKCAIFIESTRAGGMDIQVLYNGEYAGIFLTSTT